MNKTSKNRKIFSTFLAATFSFVIFSISSCSFFMENEIPQEEAQQNEISQQGEAANPTNKQFYTLSINPIFGTNTSRSAYPAFSDTQLSNYTFHAFCTNEFDEVQGVYNSTSGQVVFTIYSSGFTGKTIKFLVKNGEGVALWFAQKESVNFTRGGSVEISTPLNFQPYTDTLGNNGTLPNGNINLTVSSPSGSTIICRIYNSTGTGTTLGESGETGKPIIVGGSTNTCSITTASGIAHGEYVAKFFIYKDGSTSSTPEFRQETIVVWPGITTDAWYLSDGSKNSTLQIAFNNEEIKIYVKGTNPQGLYSDTGLPLVATVADASNSNAGTILAPLETINAAIAKCTCATINYKIICDGDLDSFSIGSNINHSPVNIKIIGGGNSSNNSTITGNNIIYSSASNLTFENIDFIVIENLFCITANLFNNSTFTLNNCNLSGTGGGIKFTGQSGKITNLLINNTVIENLTNLEAIKFLANDSYLIFKGSSYITPTTNTNHLVRLNKTNKILIDGPLTSSNTTLASVWPADDIEIGTQIFEVQNGASLATELQRFDCLWWPKIFDAQGKLDFTKDFYVASTDSSPAGSNIGIGSATDPNTSVIYAIDQIRMCANTTGGAGNYKIHISGTIQEPILITTPHTLPEGIEDPGTLEAFTGSTLTLCGTNSTNDILDGNDTLQVIKIAGNIDVTITNLTIQRGQYEYGAGIIIGSDSTVKLGAGVKVTKNKTTDTSVGGAIYNEGKLCIYDNAIIGYAATTTFAAESNVLNHGGNSRAGIYNNGGQIWLGYTSPDINATDDSGNSCQIAGNLYCGIDCNGGEIYLHSGSIHHNFATMYGGGVYLHNTATLTMDGGSISNNETDNYGGGLFISDTDTFSFTGGIMERNSCPATKRGGAVYNEGIIKIGNTASIPDTQNTVGKNDVFLRLDSTSQATDNPKGIIKTTGNLNPSGGKYATIHPSAYNADYYVVKQLDSVDANFYTYFGVMPNSTQTWGVNEQGKLQRIYAMVGNTICSDKTEVIEALGNASGDIELLLGSSVTYTEIGASSTTNTIAYAIKNNTTNVDSIHLILPPNISTLNAQAFFNCSKIKGELKIPASLSSIPSSAFMQTGIESLILPSGVTVVGIRAFSGCASLSSITWNNIQKLDTESFASCTSLHEVTIPSTTTIISHAFGGAGLTSLTFSAPSGWKKSGTNGGGLPSDADVTLTNPTTNATTYKTTSYYYLYK